MGAQTDMKVSISIDMLNLARGNAKHRTSLRTSPWIGETNRMTQLRDSTSNISDLDLRVDMMQMSDFGFGNHGGSNSQTGVPVGRASLTSTEIRGTATMALGSQTDRLHSLKGTVWDAALLLGLESIGFASNFSLALSLATNIILQLLFCWIVTYLPEDEDYKDAGVAVFTWIANASVADVAGVCELSQSMPHNYQQYRLLDQARGYVREFLPGVPYEQGPILCGIVLTAWTLSICVVLREVIDFVSCMTQLCDRSVDRVVLVNSLQRYHLEAVPVHRMIWAWALGAVQASIALILLWYGALWLSTTTAPSELVLNAVALTYVMEIDELLFLTTVPRQVSSIIRNLDPMDLYVTSGTLNNIPVRALMSALVIIIFVSSFSFTYLDAHLGNVSAVVLTLSCD